MRRGHIRFYPRIDLGGDIFNADKLVQFEAGALHLFCLSLGVKTGLDVVVSLGRDLLHTCGPYVMIGEGQSISGNKRSRAAIIEAHRRQANMVQPGLSQFEAVLGFNLGRGRRVVKPHAFVGHGQIGKYKGARKQNRAKAFHVWMISSIRSMTS